MIPRPKLPERIKDGTLSIDDYLVTNFRFLGTPATDDIIEAKPRRYVMSIAHWYFAVIREESMRPDIKDLKNKLENNGKKKETYLR